MMIIDKSHTKCPHCGTKVELIRMHKGDFDVRLPAKCPNCGSAVKRKPSFIERLLSSSIIIN